MGLLVVVIPVGFVWFLTRQKNNKIIMMGVVGMAFLAGVCGGAIFMKIYPEVMMGDTIKDTQGADIQGYYHNYSVFRDEKNYDEIDGNTQKGWDNIFFSRHEAYMDNFDIYSDGQKNALFSSMAGLVTGFVASMIIVCGMGFVERGREPLGKSIMGKLFFKKKNDDEFGFD